MRTEDKVMNNGKLQARQDTLKSLHCPSTQSSLFNSRGSSLSSRLSSLSSHSPTPVPHQRAKSPSFNPQHSITSATRCSQHKSECVTRCLQHNDELATRSPQHLFIDVSTELLRRGQSVRFRAPGWSMHPTIKEGETIKVAPVAPLDIKRGDILLCLVGRKVIAHRVIRIKRKKSDSTTHSSKLNPQHLFILRGDASATCDEPVKAQQVLAKVVSVERGGCCVDLYSRRVKMLRIAHAWASSLKRLIVRLLKINQGVGLTFGGLQ